MVRLTSREHGKKLLATVLNIQTNIDILEKKINLLAKNERDYMFMIYQTVTDINQNKSTLTSISKRLSSGQVGWRHPVFDDLNDEFHEIYEFIKNPFEVVEGIFTCNKCNSKRVFSYQKQTRACDESATTFAQCSNCGAKWTYSG
jgi:DNA-directed RNA polymerase subunit M/transcription elongation factor TFIIS